MTTPAPQGIGPRFDMVITDSPTGDGSRWLMMRIDTPFAGYAVGLEPGAFLKILPDFYYKSMELCDQAISETRASGIVVASPDALHTLGKDLH